MPSWKHALVIGKSRKINLGHDIKSGLKRRFHITGDSANAGRKSSGDKVTDIRKGGIVKTIDRGKRRDGSNGGRIHSSTRWLGRQCLLGVVVCRFVGRDKNARSCG